MIGLGQLRAYRILAKRPRHMPPHSANDVRLFRIISRGAFAYVVAAWIAYLLVTKLLVTIDHDVLFPFVIPVTLFMLVCWWTTDVAPRFARWSIITIAAIASVVSITFIALAPIWTKIEAAGLLLYFAYVAKETNFQLRAIERFAHRETKVEDNAT